MGIISILIALLMFGFMIFIHELGHFMAARVSNVKVNEFALGMGPAIFKKTVGETTYSLRAFPIGGFCAMEGEDEESYDQRAYCSAPLKNRMLISVAGAVMNILLGLIIMAVLTWMRPSLSYTTIGQFPEGSVSAQYLEINDEIIRVNGHKVKTLNDIIYEFNRDRDGLVSMVVNRENVVKNFDIQFNLDPESRMVDFDFYVYGIKDVTFGQRVFYTFNWTKSTMLQVWGSFVDLVTGRFSVKELSGPIGVTNVISDVVTDAVKSEYPLLVSMQTVLMLFAFITINLGVFNLIPLPALDGGRLAFMLLELIRGKPLNPKYENYVHATGFMLLIGLMIFVTFNDIIKLF